MHVTDWAAVQKEGAKLDAVLQWLESKKKTDLRTLPQGGCIKQARPDDMEKLTEFHYHPRTALPVLHSKRGE